MSHITQLKDLSPFKIVKTDVYAPWAWQLELENNRLRIVRDILRCNICYLSMSDVFKRPRDSCLKPSDVKQFMRSGKFSYL